MAVNKFGTNGFVDILSLKFIQFNESAAGFIKKMDNNRIESNEGLYTRIYQKCVENKVFCSSSSFVPIGAAIYDCFRTDFNDDK